MPSDEECRQCRVEENVVGRKVYIYLALSENSIQFIYIYIEFAIFWEVILMMGWLVWYIASSTIVYNIYDKRGNITQFRNIYYIYKLCTVLKKVVCVF